MTFVSIQEKYGAEQAGCHEHKFIHSDSNLSVKPSKIQWTAQSNCITDLWTENN